MKLIKTNLLPGFLTWLIPFALSFLFYKPGGELAIPYDLFKSIMVVIASLSGCYFLFRYFRSVTSDFVLHGVNIGISWLLINLVLDVLILLPIMKVGFDVYLMSIGLRYLMIPVMSLSMGFLLQAREGEPQ